MEKAIFLDRDGVINKDPGLNSYVSKIEDFIINKGVYEALINLQKKGFILIVITNQSGIARGHYSKEDFFKITDFMINDLKNKGIEIKEVYFCPHHPDENCNCRKPKIFFVEEARKKYNIDLENSWLIGDSETDIELGINSRCKTILVGEKHINLKPDFKSKDLLEASKIIENGIG